MSQPSIYEDRIVRVAAGCPVCHCSYFQVVNVIHNSAQCTECGAWVILYEPPEPEPHHNID